MKIPALLLFTSFLCQTLVRGETVAIDYVLDSAQATIEPFTIPNPQGGADITITPSVTLDSGTFEADFANADAAGLIADGDSSIIGTEFAGELSILLESTIDVFGFPFAVSATVAGPLRARQVSDSTGTLAGLSIYAELSPGDYDIEAGPLGCSDSAFGAFCAALEAGLGLQFPIDGVASTSALPFSGGTFADLNPGPGSGRSSVSSQIEFSLPLTGDLSFGVAIDTRWLEVERITIVPEPSVAALLIGALGVGLRRRR